MTVNRFYDMETLKDAWYTLVVMMMTMEILIVIMRFGCSVISLWVQQICKIHPCCVCTHLSMLYIYSPTATASE